MDVGGLFNNKEQYFGYRVDIGENSFGGIVTDMWTAPSQPGWYMVVVDGRLHCIGGKTKANIHMPRKPETQPRHFFKIAIEGLFIARHGYYGKAIRYEPDAADIGTFTAMTEGKAKSYVVVVDGNIIHFARDAYVWVEL
jgi:hypothetical protein